MHCMIMKFFFFNSNSIEIQNYLLIDHIKNNYYKIQKINLKLGNYPNFLQIIFENDIFISKF